MDGCDAAYSLLTPLFASIAFYYRKMRKITNLYKIFIFIICSRLSLCAYSQFQILYFPLNFKVNYSIFITNHTRLEPQCSGGNISGSSRKFLALQIKLLSALTGTYEALVFIFPCLKLFPWRQLSSMFNLSKYLIKSLSWLLIYLSFFDVYRINTILGFHPTQAIPHFVCCLVLISSIEFILKL